MDMAVANGIKKQTIQTNEGKRQTRKDREGQTHIGTTNYKSLFNLIKKREKTYPIKYNKNLNEFSTRT